MAEGNLLELDAPYWTRGEGNDRWPLNKYSIAHTNALQVKKGPGKLYGFTVYNSKNAAQFILVIDSDATAVPGNGVLAACVFTVATVANLGVSWADVGRPFDAGCWLVNSSTEPTLTIGSADCSIDAQYV